MSRIGKKGIEIPEKTLVTVNGDVVVVKDHWVNYQENLRKIFQ
jgi:ribosomal protein L6P/L9E